MTKRVLAMDIRKAICSKGFALTAILVLLLYMLDGAEMLAGGGCDVLSLYMLISTIGSLHWLVPCVGVLAYGASYISERESHVTKYIQLRCGCLRYSISKIISCFLSAALATSLGIYAFLGIACAAGMPFAQAQFLTSYVSSADSISLFSLIRDGHYLPFVILRVSLTGATAGFWAVFGLAVSAVWPSKYIALAAPAFVAYFKDNIYAWIGAFPTYVLKDIEWCEYPFPGVIGPVGLSMSIILCLSTVFAGIFAWKVRWQATHE